MTGLLQRMALRARNPAADMARIEPVLPSRYARFAVGARAQPAIAPGEMSGSVDARVTPPAAVTTLSAPGAQPLMRRAMSSELPLTAHGAWESAARDETGLAIHPSVSGSPTREPPGESSADIPSTGASRLPSSPTPIMTATAGAPVTVPATVTIAQASLVTQVTLPNQPPTPRQTRSTLPNTSPAHTSQFADLTPSPGSAPPSPPEITVSIGHIEVHSANPRPAPRRAEFRPRVSLDDFLGRRGGGRR
jgi:hypothetical protein